MRHGGRGREEPTLLSSGDRAGEMVGRTPQMTIGGGGWGVLYPVKDRTNPLSLWGSEGKRSLLTSSRKPTVTHPKAVAVGSRRLAEQGDAGNSLRRLRELGKGALRGENPL